MSTRHKILLIIFTSIHGIRAGSGEMHLKFCVKNADKDETFQDYERAVYKCRNKFLPLFGTGCRIGDEGQHYRPNQQDLSFDRNEVTQADLGDSIDDGTIKNLTLKIVDFSPKTFSNDQAIKKTKEMAGAEADILVRLGDQAYVQKLVNPRSCYIGKSSTIFVLEPFVKELGNYNFHVNVFPDTLSKSQSLR